MADSQRKTANLFDKDNVTFNSWYSANGTITQPAIYGCITAMIPVTTDTLTISWSGVQPNSYSFVYFDVNGDFIERKHKAITPDDKSYTATTPDGATQFIAQVSCPTNERLTQEKLDSFKIMLNTGSTPLPYEPYGWQHSLRKLGTSTDTLTTLPADVYADGQSATVGLVGNMSQSGTPTPTTPIQPSETGERTGNLFDGTLIGGAFKDNEFNIATSSSTSVFKSIKIFLSAGTYTFSWGKNVNVIRLVIDDVYSQIGGSSDIASYTITSTTDNYVGISFRDTTSSSTDWDMSTPIMLNTGSTALPFEPHGVKIPISSASTTTPVYLGEVETTRKIKKLVLTGEEAWRSTSGVFYLETLENDYLRVSNIITAKCSHYGSQTQPTGASGVEEGNCVFGNTTSQRMYIRDTSISGSANFKTYLQQQYAAGTPVCVWYVLAEPTTGIVNEPLRKIGDYADTVSGITIPTIAGADSFDVLTTLKPSEVSLAYTGWHDASVKEWDGSEWE